MILGCIRHIMKENQLLLKDLLEFDKLDIDKLVPVPADLNKLNDVVKNDAVKRDVYNKLVTKVDNIDTSRFILKFKYDTDKSELEKKIPDISNLALKLQKLKINLAIIIMINILLLQSLIN